MDNRRRTIFFNSGKISGEVSADHTFLCNFFPCEFVENGVAYRTVEHYFQSKKYNDPEIIRVILNARTPKQAKSLTRNYPIDFVWWGAVRESVMKAALNLKFTQNPELLQKLLDTHNAILKEYSKSDLFWGGSLPNSSNKLGLLLMEVRSELANKSN